MKLIYKNKTVEKECTNLKKLRKKYGKNIALKIELAIDTIKNAEDMSDIIGYHPFKFHALKEDKKGYFSLDIGGRKSNYRMIIEPMDCNGKRFNPCNIDEIIKEIDIIFIVGVNTHEYKRI